MGKKAAATPEAPEISQTSGHKVAPGDSLKITSQGAKSAAAELSQQPAIALEEDTQHLGDSENDLAVRNIQEECLPHPHAPLLKALGMTRRAETTGAAGEHQEVFRMAVWTADAGKPAARVATVQIALHMLQNCAQIVPKNIENYRKISRSIET